MIPGRKEIWVYRSFSAGSGGQTAEFTLTSTKNDLEINWYATPQRFRECQENDGQFIEYAREDGEVLELISPVEQPQLTCGAANDIARITNVQNFTNLRRQAGLDGQVIGQVQLGAQVSVVNPGQYLRYDRCAAACNGTNQNAIKQCIDNNDVWIEVEYDGRRGFLSRKFLQ